MPSSRLNPVKIFLSIFLSIVVFSFLFPQFFPSLPTGENLPHLTKERPHDKDNMPPPTWVSEPHAELPELQHDYLPNGLLKTNMAGTHPMLELIAEGERKWKLMLGRQSKSRDQAVAEYKRRYHRLPPRGFDEWYNFASSRDFRLIDEFDQIDRDIKPLLSVPPSVLKERLKELKSMSESSGFIVNVSTTHSTVELNGPASEQQRARLLHSNILAFSRWLPDLELFVNGNDRSSRITSSGLRQWMAESKGELTSGDLQKLENVIRHGGDSIFSACATPPPKDLRVDTQIMANTPEPPTFIHDPTTSSDMCLNPALVQLHGSLSFHQGARDARLYPEFVWAKPTLGGEILLPFIENFNAFTLTRPHPWSEKTFNKLFWRGISTGSHHQIGRGGPLGWRGGSQRLRATFLFSNESAFSKASWISTEVHLLTVTSGGLHTTTYPRSALNGLYTDVGLVKPLVQCEEGDGTCAEMNIELQWRPERGTWGIERGKWKYVLDLDANGQSADFQKSLGLGSVVFKSTIFSQWNSDWLVPYYHYIPVKQDFSDMHNAMAFFVGPPSSVAGNLKIDETLGNDHLAQKIGGNAERFVREFWRWEDVQIYMYRLLLEYARLVSDDRNLMDYDG